MSTSRKKWLSVKPVETLGTRTALCIFFGCRLLCRFIKRGCQPLLMAGVNPIILVISMLSSLMMAASSERSCCGAWAGSSLQPSSSSAVEGTTLILSLPFIFISERVVLNNAACHGSSVWRANMKASLSTAIEISDIVAWR